MFFLHPMDDCVKMKLFFFSYFRCVCTWTVRSTTVWPSAGVLSLSPSRPAQEYLLGMLEERD